MFVRCSFQSTSLTIKAKLKYFNETRASQEKSKLFLRLRNVKNCKRKKFELSV